VVLHLVRWLTLAATTLLMAGFFGAWIPMSDSLAQFRSWLAVAVVVGVVLSLLSGMKRTAIVAALAVGAAIWLSHPHLPFTGPPAEGKAAVKLIQFNVKIHNDREAEAAQWIISEAPDVLTLQEYLDETHPSFRALGSVLPHGVKCKSRRGEVALRTKLPVLAQGCLAGDGLAWMQVDVNGKRVTFASMHLHWPWPFRQWEQLARLEASFAAMPQPVVLAGDFNATPWSAAVKTVERQIKSKAVGGYRTTLWLDVLHNGKSWPALPIDHVLLPEGMTAKSIRVGPMVGSDHLPVIVEFDP
jgi:endonuclease/exonuclease/phosphatase (EEP) superfamily protein YafD